MLPQAFLQRMQKLLQEEYADFLQSYSQARTQGLRVNPLKLSPKTFEAMAPFSLQPVPWAAEGFYYSEQQRPGRHPFHEAGLYYIQEPSAMSAAVALDPQPGERILDLCAAPGGKTTHLAGRMAGEGLLVANEIQPSRAKALSQNLERLGVANALVLNEDSGRLAERFPGFFDRILVDAPCSGEGMFRKDPDACGEWSEEGVRACAQRQLIILKNAVRMLRPGGRLVYSTCTFSPEENEGTVAALLSEEPALALADSGLLDFFSPGRGDWIPNPPPGIQKTVRIWPHRVLGEGHFVAAFERADDGGFAPPPAQKPLKDSAAMAAFEDFCSSFLNENPLKGGIPLLFGAELYRLPAGCFSLDGLRVVRPGLHLGTLKKNRFEPSHALSHSLPTGAFSQRLSLSAQGEETAAYLRGETLKAEGLSGWTAVEIDGFVLGWGKASGGVLKNHYPKGLRRQGPLLP